MMNAVPDQTVTSSSPLTALPSFRHKDNSSIPLGAYSNRRQQLPSLHRTDYNHHQHHRYYHSRHRHHRNYHHHHHHHDVRGRISDVQTQLPNFLDRKLSPYGGTRSATDGRESTEPSHKTVGAVDLGRDVTDEQAKSFSDFEGTGGDPRQAWRSKISESHFRVSLDNLNDHASAAASQLDHSYYSLLEHVGYLQSGVEQLITLSRDIREASSEHDVQLSQLCTDLHGQMDTFGNFELQRQRIYDLECRLRREKESAEDFKSRLDLVRQRLRNREKEDAENWKQTRLRLRILWGSIVSIILLFCIIAIFQRFWSESSVRFSRIKEKSQAIAYNDNGNTNGMLTPNIATTIAIADKKRKMKGGNRWQNIFDEL